MKSHYYETFTDFKCIHCRNLVSTNIIVSGVNNRNHCPYCLHSRHLDLYEAGDRLSACKAGMRPIGLTFKQTRKKYSPQRGELMLIHLCSECGKVSVNRIAADDDAETIYDVYRHSLALDVPTRALLERNGVQALTSADTEAVCAQLFGWKAVPCYQPAYAEMI